MTSIASITKDARIYVAGHRGLVGSALVRRLLAGGYENILARTRSELDLLDHHPGKLESHPDLLSAAVSIAQESGRSL